MTQIYRDSRKYTCLELGLLISPQKVTCTSAVVFAADSSKA
jgi:hypothetical protein